MRAGGLTNALLATGDRVRLRRGAGFPEGITGTIQMPIPFLLENSDGSPRNWHDCRLTIEIEKGCHVFYWVEFDEPHDDGSGDGPYRASEIGVEYLEPLL